MRTYRRGVYKFLCVHGYIILLPSCTMFDRANSMSSLARLYASSSRVEVLERSSRVRVLERSSTSTSARVLECEGSDLRVKLEYECSSARVSHIETSIQYLQCTCNSESPFQIVESSRS